MTDNLPTFHQLVLSDDAFKVLALLTIPGLELLAPVTRLDVLTDAVDGARAMIRRNPAAMDEIIRQLAPRA